MNRALLLAPLLALAASPAAAQTRAAVTASATVAAPLDTRAPASNALESGGAALAPSPRPGAPRITVTLPDGARCTGGAPAGGPVHLPCRTSPGTPARAVVVAAS